MTKFSLYGFLVTVLGFSGSAFASQCPDIQGSYKYPGDSSRVIRRHDYWVIPISSPRKTLNIPKTLDNLAASYPSRNTPTFTCYDRMGGGMNYCETPSGSRFEAAYPGSGINIPSKSGVITLVGQQEYDYNKNSVSCKRQMVVSYYISGIYELRKSGYPDLPYLLLQRSQVPLQVQQYGSSPVF